MIINKVQESYTRLYFYIFKTFNSEFQTIEVRFTDQNSQSLEIEERINLTLIIKCSIYYKNEIFSSTSK